MCSGDRAVTLTVKKAMEILDCLAGARTSISCSEIARRLEMPRSTTYRLLSTLTVGGYVLSEGDGLGKEYRLGFEILELVSSLLDGMALRRRALPLLRQPRDVTEETVHLVVADRGEVTYMEKVDSLKSVRMHSAVGRQGGAGSIVHDLTPALSPLAFRKVDAQSIPAPDEVISLHPVEAQEVHPGDSEGILRKLDDRAAENPDPAGETARFASVPLHVRSTRRA